MKDYKTEAHPRLHQLPKIWWIRWEDGSLGTSSKSYEEAEKIAKAKGIPYVIM